MRLPTRSALVRLAKIDAAIRGGGWPNVTTLSKQLEVNPRTIQRDLDYFRNQLGAPIGYDASRRGYFYTTPSYRISYQQITEGECLALFLAERLLEQYRGAPFAADLARLFEKLSVFLPDEITFDLGHLGQALAFQQAAADPGDADRFRHLLRAVHDGRQLELVYWAASRDETIRRRVDPYGLASIEGDWYLVAYCQLREDTRMFMLGRIRELTETGATFDRPADFRLTDYLDAGFRRMRGVGPAQTVRLRFTPTIARYVKEKTWHPTQSLRDLPDGGLELTLRANHLLEVKRWAMSFGCECEVIEPAELRAEIVQEARKLCAPSKATKAPPKLQARSLKRRGQSGEAENQPSVRSV